MSEKLQLDLKNPEEKNEEKSKINNLTPELPEVNSLSDKELIRMEKKDEKYVKTETKKAKRELEKIFYNDDKTESLNKRESEEETENLEKMNQEELKSLEDGFYKLSEDVQKLSSKFIEREQEKLNPLIDSENIGRLKTSALNLESAIKGDSIKSEHLKEAVQKLIRAIDNIGVIQNKRRVVREDENSLLKISSILKDIEEDCRTVFRDLSKIKKEDVKDMVGSIRRLGETSGDKRNKVRRRAQDIRDYQF